MNKLYILDASGYIYRSYFAIRNITNAKGESTNALFGFIRSLQKLRKDFNPDHLVAVFDGPRGGQKREAIYTEYKAHRAATPPDLIYQIDWARQACQLMNVPFLSVPGVEADDTMGSIALWAEKNGYHVYLCTSDKDLCQLVNPNISILNTFKENLVIGPKEVEEIHGVTPAQMIDYLAITGDASDNVPGMPGLGPKTASALLKEHGTLDYILEHPEIVSGKKKEIIEQYREQALLSRKLVTIHTDVDFPKDRDFFLLKPFDIAALKHFYADMNFNTLIKELDQLQHKDESLSQAPSHVEETVNYTLVDDEISLDKLMKTLSACKEIGITVKGTSDQPIKSELVGIAFCVTPLEAWYLPANGKLGIERVLKALRQLMDNKNISFFGHNIKYDLLLLENYGIEIPKISFDTCIASYVLNSHMRQRSCEYLMLEHFGKSKKDLNALLGKGKKAITILQLFPEEMMQIACEEIDYIARLKELFTHQLKERKLAHIVNDLELPLLSVLAKMERHGIYLDNSYLNEMSKEVMAQINELEQEIYRLAGENFNINSSKQVGHILFEKMGIKPPRKTATGHSTDADVLDSLQKEYPIAGKILEYRGLEKLRSTYIDSLPTEVFTKTARIHCTFNQAVAATGRLSCQDPNLQNIPIRTEIGRKIRGAFRPQKEGWSYLSADYSQIELRLLAHLSEDPELIRAFQAGEDIHTHTAAIIYGIPVEQVSKSQRHNAKAVNFGIVYGQQAFGLSQELGIEVKEAAAFIETYFKQYKRVKEYVESAKEVARQSGRSITYTGRERLIPEIHSKNGQIRAAAERLAINTPLQGTAADLIKMAMLQIDKQLTAEKMLSYMILQIHDELIFEAPDSELPALENMVRKAMQEVLKLKVPLVVDINIGKNWEEC